MTVRIIALPKNAPVLLRRKLRIVVKVRSRKLNLARNQNHIVLINPPLSPKSVAPSIPPFPAHAPGTMPRAHSHTAPPPVCNTGCSFPGIGYAIACSRTPHAAPTEAPLPPPAQSAPSTPAAATQTESTAPQKTTRDKPHAASLPPT